MMMSRFSEARQIFEFLLGFIVILGSIGLIWWVARRFERRRLDLRNECAQSRLAVVEASAVDTRRHMILIRRDNVEHLVMIGGNADIVVERNIVRALERSPPYQTHPTNAPDDLTAESWRELPSSERSDQPPLTTSEDESVADLIQRLHRVLRTTALEQTK
jgi:flagellar biogenesis protein FliO